MKTCAKCGETKPIDEFHRDKRKVDGRRSRCKTCENAWQREFQHQHKTETGQYYSRKYRYERTCIQCSKVWSTPNKQAKYCSNTCQAEHEHGVDRIPKRSRAAYLKRQRLLRRMAKAAAGTRGVVPFVAGPCASCGIPIVARRSAIRWCSKKCKQSQKAARRRAIKRDAYVEDVSRQKIFERDRWRCRLCNQKVAADQVAPHPLAPVLDHIIPLARGGTHEAANVQCAHFLCNSVKSDRGGGEQLLLIG